MRLRVSVRFIFRDFWIVRLSDTRAPYTSLTQFYKTSRNRQSLPLHTENQPGMQRCERQVGASLSSSLFTFSTQPPPSHLVQYVQTSASPQKLWSVATVWNVHCHPHLYDPLCWDHKDLRKKDCGRVFACGPPAQGTNTLSFKYGRLEQTGSFQAYWILKPAKKGIIQ